MKNLRVRYAPSNSSPTGIHVGNLRTFQYSWLLAKKYNGTVILRMEDSDKSRCKPEYANSILEQLKWVGIEADEGYGCKNSQNELYTQTGKASRYKDLADQLIDRDLAYRCYCSNEELELQRSALLAASPRAQYKYPYTCRDRKDQPKNKPYVVRFKAPTEGETVLDDLVFGKIKLPYKENQDFVLVRSDGTNLYNFGCFVDDWDNGTSLIIRGRDHIINYIPQQLLYNAFNVKVPIMAHLGMINGQDGTKLSKRHCATSISEYKNMGYSPNAVLNYIARLGWGNGDNELFSIEQLIESFSLESCSKSDSKFDPIKFASINTSNLKSEVLTSTKEYAKHTRLFLNKAGLNPAVDKLENLIPLVRSRSKTFIEASNELDPILRKNISIDSVAAEKFMTTENKPKLKAFSDAIATVNNWTENNIRTATQNWLKQSDLTLKDIGQCVRVAITGKTNSPELFMVMAALGKDTTLSRIQNYIN